jgi:hypothetical protein
MNRMRMLSTIMGVLLTAVFLSSCGAPQLPTTVVEVPTPTVEDVLPTAVEEVTPTAKDEVSRISIEELKERQLPTTKDEVPRISVEELNERIGRGEAIVIGDTRDQSSFELSHLAGAIVITSSLVEALLDDLPLDQEIVLYCA